MKRRTIILVATLTVALFALAAIATGQSKLTRENWGKEVGFAPDLSNAPKAGTVVNSANMGEWSAMIPEGVKVLMTKYGYKFTVKDYEPIAPANTYIEATNKYRGQAKIVDNGGNPRKLGLTGYTAGLPFPKPQNGLEVAWNYTYSYQGDDADNYFSVFWIDAKSGVERSEIWRWMYINRAVNRTDIAPIPAFDEAAKDGKQYYSVTITQYPQDKKGFAALYYRMIEPQDQQGFIYIPAQKKSTRFAFGTRGDAWNNTDLLYEDVRGYLGYPEWMNWKIVEKKTMLLPMNSEIPWGKDAARSVYDFDTAPHWNFNSKWEPRPVYVVEATAKFKDYPYSRMVFYVDAESSFIAVKDAYDKKGQLWKVLINAWNKSENPATQPAAIGTSLVVDLQSEHATAFGWHSAKINVGLKPDQFTLTKLRKLGD